MRADSGLALSLLRVDGGASANNILMQFQADILQTTIHRSQVIETTALGAAYLAAMGVGLFDGTQAISENWVLDRAYVPSMHEDEVNTRLRAWDKSVASA
jgi:glycerol kinase